MRVKFCFSLWGKKLAEDDYELLRRLYNVRRQKLTKDRSKTHDYKFCGVHLSSNIVAVITSKRVRLGEGHFGYLTETSVWRDNIKIEFRETNFRYKINWSFHKLNMKVMFLQFVQNCYPSSYHVKRRTVQQITSPHFNPNRQLKTQKSTRCLHSRLHECWNKS
jgi:hypothetical protein